MIAKVFPRIATRTVSSKVFDSKAYVTISTGPRKGWNMSGGSHQWLAIDAKRRCHLTCCLESRCIETKVNLKKPPSDLGEREATLPEREERIQEA